MTGHLWLNIKISLLQLCVKHDYTWSITLVLKDFQTSNTNAFDPDRAVLFSVLPEESKPFVCGILDKTYPDDVLSAGADTLNMLSQDNPVTALLPLRCIQPVLEICQTMLQAGSIDEDLRFCPEISFLLRSAENVQDSHKREILFFVHN